MITMTDISQPLVIADNLVKIYKVADLEVVALQGLDIEVAEGEIIALVGPSGAGKSTLLNVIGGLDVPSAGVVQVAGLDLLQMKERDRIIYKRQSVGFVWQQPARNLLTYLSARENVELPMMLNGVKGKKRRQRALELLEMVDLLDRSEFSPDRLSGGQQQRVALAVALANNPRLILGDELTGQVDSESALQVYESLRRINEAFGTTIILVTHDPQVAGLVDRVIAIRDGRTSTEIRRQRGSDGAHGEEWVILDRVGRLQIPEVFVEKLNLHDRVKVRLEEDHVSVWASGETLRTTIINETTKEKRIGAIDFDKTRDEIPGAEIQVEELWRVFPVSGGEVHAVQDVSFTIPSGVVAVVKGRSGSGKTSLLNLIAGLDEPTSGTVLFDGRDLSMMNSREKIQLRRRKIGFVYQTFGLLPYLSAGENVQVPLRLVRAKRKYRQERVYKMLDLVGLGKRIDHRTYELSGGEQQRVAIARALVNQPSLLFADEPTGQLDTVTGLNVIRLLREITNQVGITVLIASHDPNVHTAADIVFELADGKLISVHDIRSDPEIIKTLEYSRELIRAGQRDLAHRKLLELLKHNPNIEEAWHLLSYLFKEREKKIYALEQVLRINPQNFDAVSRLKEISIKVEKIPEDMVKPIPPFTTTENW
jgi:peptide/nickel transport system ATP-binding protein